MDYTVLAVLETSDVASDNHEIRAETRKEEGRDGKEDD